MAYDKFTTNKVFSNELVNITLNRLMERINTRFPGQQSFALQGSCANIIQGGAVIEPPVVQFVTSDAEIYFFLVTNVSDILNANTQVSFENRIQLVTAHAFLEIWYDGTLPAPIDVNGISCRDMATGQPYPAAPYNIILDDPQIFSVSAENKLYFQGWELLTPSPIKIYYVVGTAVPPAIPIDVIIENYFLTSSSNEFVTFNIKAAVNSSQDLTGHLALTGGDIVTEAGLDLTEQNLAQSINLILQNTSLLSPGDYTARVSFYGTGVDPTVHSTNSPPVSDIPVELTVLDDQNDVAADTNAMFFAHIKDQLPLAPQSFKIYTAGGFTINVPSFFELTGEDLQLNSSILSRDYYGGNGSQTITIQLKESFSDFAGTIFQSYLEIKYSSVSTRSTRFIPFTINLTAYLRDAAGFNTTPVALEFFTIKGLEQAESQNLQVVGTEAYDILFPFWLKVSPIAGNFSGVHQVQPIDPSNLTPGVYQGIISIVGASSFMDVPVTLTVVESINPAFSLEDLNFTDDNLDFTYLYSSDMNERGSVDIGLTRYNAGGFSAISQHAFKVAFFRNRAGVHLGEIVKRRLVKIDSLDEIDFKIHDLELEEFQLYKIHPFIRPALATVALQIENRNSLEVSIAKNYQDVAFVAGRTPEQYENNFGILQAKEMPLRVTPNSQVLFNFVRWYSEHEIKIYRNTQLEKTITHSPGNNSLFGLAMFFKEFTPGDVIDVRLKKNDTENFTQKYVVFPPGSHSNHIVYLDEYYCLQSYEFTGEFRFFTDREYVTAKTFGQLVEKLENLDIKKEQRLIINTGWVLKSNQLVIDAILDAKRVWFAKNGKEISLVPVTKKKTEEDSEQELYEYDVEFIINRKNDLEVYTSGF